MFGFGFEISKSQTENSQVTYVRSDLIHTLNSTRKVPRAGNRRSAPLYNTSTLESNQSRKKPCTFHHYRISRCVEGASPSFEVTRPAAMCALLT
ncbi:hypothetical protein ACN38_g8326 [Penicillium nordicum]|uniref:Uncharacterized protein n=1 Tax=Penicillium nordicum TaxID=229535 RepID=A0A0M8NWI7_9EURO|nr:hypothetical protein ACN38_g8326 [Penicillium nordicum]